MSDPYLGEIRMVGFNFAPVNWAPCNGQLMGISQYQALFALLGTTYGGDGVRTFALPNLQCRLPVHSGTNAGLGTIVQGQVAGAQNVTLNLTNLPSHTHAGSLTGGNTPTVNVAIQAGGEIAQGAVPNPPFLAGFAAGTGRTAGPGLYGSSSGTSPANLGGVSASISGGPTGVTIAPTGGNAPFNIQNPYLGLYFVIALAGIFPSRN